MRRGLQGSRLVALIQDYKTIQQSTFCPLAHVHAEAAQVPMDGEDKHLLQPQPIAILTTGELFAGPLGQGIANGVGLAAAEKHLAARFNKEDNKIIDHYT